LDHEIWGDSAIEKTSGSEIVDDINFEPTDILIKTRFSAFFKTDLESKLQLGNINTLLLCSVQSHVCIPQTALDAFYRNYWVIAVRDRVSSSGPEKREMSLRYADDYLGETTCLSCAETILER